MQSLKKQLIRLGIGIGLLFFGSILVVIGLIIALIVDTNWLTLCIIGFVMAIIGLLLIVAEIRRLGGGLNSAVEGVFKGKSPRK